MTVRTFDASAFLARYDAMDRALVAAGFPATSPWWRAELERFVRSDRRRWVLRVGRRGGKSSTLCRLAVAWALWGTWSVPPGDVAVVPFVSVDRDEAAARLRTIRDILGALRAGFDERGEEVELRDRRAVFRVVTCSVRGAVGFTSIAAFADEMAKWESRETAANPAREVMGSLRPTMATQAHAFEVYSSSPWSLDDYHAELFDASDTHHQVASFAPTWTANPTLTEARTRELESDERIWRREYAAIPSAATSAALDPDAISAAQRPSPAELTIAAPVVCLDFSSGRGDAVAWAAVRWAWQRAEPEFLSRPIWTGARDHDGQPIYFDEPILDEHGRTVPNPSYAPRPPLLVFGPIESVTGAFWRSVSSDQLVARVARDCRRWGAGWVIGDQHSSYALEALFAREGIRFCAVPWSNPNKQQAVVRVRRWLRDQMLVLPVPEPGKASTRLDRELRAFEEKLLPSGVATYQGRRGEHDDHVATLVTAAIADSLGLLPLNPMQSRRYVLDPRDLPNFATH